MKSPEDYVGCEIKADISTLPVSIVNTDTNEKIVYCQRFAPSKMGSEEHRQYHCAGAFAYEIYVICSDGKIEIINHRIEQTPCCPHSHAPNSAPAWLFPEGAMFDIDWEEIIPSVKKRMLKTLDAFICAPAKPRTYLRRKKVRSGSQRL